MLAADLLVVDERLTLPGAQKLKKLSSRQRDQYEKLEMLIDGLLAGKGMQRGDKVAIGAEDLRDLSVAMAGLPTRAEAGGATADVLTTMKHLANGRLHADFLGVTGQDGVNDQIISEDIRRSGITLDPGPTADGRCATSLVFSHPDGKRTIMTYPGNAAEKLHADQVTDERVAKADSLFLPISLWSKFDESLPQTLLAKATQQDKQIILSIPKQARFGYSGEQDIHKRLIPAADIIVADESELARWYKTGGDYERATSLLQADMALRDGLRAQSGKPPRGQAATAFIKHGDDSATVLVAGASPQRYEIAAPAQIAPKRHSLGVDDAMYAGFITALHSGRTPEEAGKFAMQVGQTKFLYDSTRIPSPQEADKATQKHWSRLRGGLENSLEELGSAFSYAKTGVANPVDPKQRRTTGQKTFDFLLYPLLANVGVFALSMVVTYHSSFNQNKANAFVQRSSWFKNQLSRIPGLGQSPQMVRNLNMVVWSFVDGSIMAPVVAAFESKRQKISRWIDEKMGTVPEDKSVYDSEIKRSFWDIVKARATTFGMVLATYFTLNAKIFPNSTKQGILSETLPNSGVFQREGVKSINGFIFDVPGKKIGGWLAGKEKIRNWAQGISNKQLSSMAATTGTAARQATETDARYQIEGIVNTGLFEAVYTSLCTAGLFILGKHFAGKRHDRGHNQPAPAPENQAPASSSNDAAATDTSTTSWAQRNAPAQKPQKAANYAATVDKSRNEATQLGV